MSDEDIASFLREVEKKRGKGSLINAASYDSDLKGIPSGVLAFDIATGIGGVPVGRVTEIYGAESSGKTSLVWAFIGEVNRAGGRAAIIDAEHAISMEWAQKFGVNPDLLFICQPDDAEQALNILDDCVRSGLFRLVALDSIAALAPRKELEGEIGDATVGLTARLMGQTLRSITPIADKTNTAIIFINQLRSKVGVMFGSPETTPGGMALKFFSSMRIDVRRIDTVKQGQVPVGAICRAKFVKNKCAPPNRVITFEIGFDEGISKVGSALDLAVEAGVVKKNGNWLQWREQKWNGRASAKDFFMSDPNQLRALVDEVLGLKPDVPYED